MIREIPKRGRSEGPCKEGTIGNTLPEKGVLTKQGTYITAILGTGILNNLHLSRDNPIERLRRQAELAGSVNPLPVLLNPWAPTILDITYIF